MFFVSKAILSALCNDRTVKDGDPVKMSKKTLNFTEACCHKCFKRALTACYCVFKIVMLV